MSRILLIEDDREVVEQIKSVTALVGHQVDVAQDESSAMGLLREQAMHLVVLGLLLLDIDGYGILTAIRRSGFSQPVLVLSENGDEYVKVRAFKLGADDYVIKPFSTLEVAARIEALLRRSGAAGNTYGAAFSDFCGGNIEIRPGERRVYRRGFPIDLNPKEYQLLLALLDRQGDVASRASLLREVWGYSESVVTRTIDTHILKLRQRLEEDPSNPRHILTVRNVGYRFKR